MSGQPVTTIGKKTTGHGPYKPRPSISGSGNVKVNGIGVVREGDNWAPHGPPPPDIHVGITHQTTSGSGTVFANGKPLARIGDSVETVDTIAGGSSNVFSG